jgi:hypothetical protein
MGKLPIFTIFSIPTLVTGTTIPRCGTTISTKSTITATATTANAERTTRVY